MPQDDDLYSQQQLIGPLDPLSSMVFITESPLFANDDRVVFPPANHENLLVASSICGFDRYLESPSESESPSSSSRRSASSSSFSLFPSDSDAQPPSEFDPKSPSGKSPPSPGDESPSADSDRQSTLTACLFDRKSTRSPSQQSGKSPPPRKSLYREADVFQDWCELLFVRVYSKLTKLVTWFSTTLRPYYPVLAIAIWWWMRVRALRRRAKGETMDRLRHAMKERDERIVQLLHQIAQMNELLVKHHKEIVSKKMIHHNL